MRDRVRQTAPPETVSSGPHRTGSVASRDSRRQSVVRRVAAPLTVGAADDAREREADRVAHSVVAALEARGTPRHASGDRQSVAAPWAGDSKIQRRSPAGVLVDARPAHDGFSRIRRAGMAGAAGGAVDADTESRIRRAQQGGSPLDAPTRARFESAFGADLGRIRVHTGPSAGELNDRVGASAFTLGPHVFFRDGLPDTSTAGGQHLLAHELTHAVQQRAVGSAPGAGEHRVQRAYEDAVVTKAGGASLHKSDRKKKAATGAAAKVRSGGVFGTGLKKNVPKDATLQVDFSEVSADGHYLLAQYNGTTGYMNASNVARAAVPTVAHDVGSGSSDVTSSESSSESEPQPPDIDQIMTSASLQDGLRQALDQIVPLTIDLVQQYIEAASQAERDKAWKDTTLMAAAKAKMSLDDYLALLPALGVFKAPTGGALAKAQGAYTTHMSAKQVDVLIGQHLGHYVKDAKAAGRKAEGEISVVGEADWQLAFQRQWPGVDPKMASAFVDVDQPKRHIWIHQDRGDPGTAIHEGMHKYANNEIRNRMRSAYRKGKVPIGMLDEGLTEYFTRKITPLLGLTRASYPDQFAIATNLVGVVGEATAAAAYYDGKFDDFISAYIHGTGRSMTHWEHFARAFEEERYPDANAIFNSGAES